MATEAFRAGDWVHLADGTYMAEQTITINGSAWKFRLGMEMLDDPARVVASLQLNGTALHRSEHESYKSGAEALIGAVDRAAAIRWRPT